MSESEATTSSSRWGDFIEMQPRQLLPIALLGAAVGAAMWLLAILVRQVIFVPLFCGDPTNSMCVGAVDSAGAVATVIAAIIGLMGLVRLSIYRPLLVVLAVAIVLWGLGGWVNSLPWFEALAWAILLYALCYIAFAWLVRPRAFVAAVVLVVLAVIVARWLPML